MRNDIIFSIHNFIYMFLYMFLYNLYMFHSFSSHAESDILFLQQQYLLKAKNKENGLNGINGRWTLAASTWWYSLLAWRNCSPFHRNFRKGWQVLSSSFCENLGTLVPWVVPRFKSQVKSKNHFANDSLWTKRIFRDWPNFKPSNGYME